MSAAYETMTNGQLRDEVRSREDITKHMGLTEISNANKDKLISMLRVSDGEEIDDKPPADVPKTDDRLYFVWNRTIRQRTIVREAAQDRVDAIHGRRRGGVPGKYIVVMNGLYITGDKEEIKFLKETDEFDHDGADGFKVCQGNDLATIKQLISKNVRHDQVITRLNRIKEAMGELHTTVKG